ncbi:MAG: prolipoprotein diacylglyceryl transferase [Clostridia bacterium]|nr:prolipoprotein diacylglyceryl transferase [Clostridia bacterium]
MFPDPIFLNVHWYGVMLAIGILAAFTVLSLYAKAIRLDEKFTDFIFFNGIASILVGFGAAALFQALYEYIENPAAGFRFSGNITFLGGLIGGTVFFLAVYFILRSRLTARLTEALSVIPCMITVGHAFGRIGCFLAGCCYGKPTDSIFGVQFPHLREPVHPTQLYEAVFLFLLFGVLSLLLLKWKFKYNMSLYLVAYGIFRFVNEIFRGDHRGELVAGISPSQFWAICMVLLGVAIFFPLKHIYDRQKATADQSDIEG